MFLVNYLFYYFFYVVVVYGYLIYIYLYLDRRNDVSFVIFDCSFICIYIEGVDIFCLVF